MNSIQADVEIDLRGESCPYPLMHTMEALAQMDSGKLLKVVTTCPSSFRNIPEEVKRRNLHAPVPAQKVGTEFVFYIYAP